MEGEPFDALPLTQDIRLAASARQTFFESRNENALAHGLS